MEKNSRKISDIYFDLFDIMMTYNHKLINNLIRKAFYDKRKMTINKEEVPESASILSITDIPPIDCSNKELQCPSDNITKRILDKDNNLKNEINLEELSKEQFLELVKNYDFK